MQSLRVRFMSNAWEACTTREMHAAHALKRVRTCISRVTTRQVHAYHAVHTREIQPLIYTSKSKMYLTRNNAWNTCHKTIPGNHICTSRVPKRVGYMPQNYNRKSYMYQTRSKTRGTHAKKLYQEFPYRDPIVKCVGVSRVVWNNLYAWDTSPHAFTAWDTSPHA